MTESQANPWARLPLRAPYVLEVDAPFVEAFNRDAKADQRLDVQLLPEPFFGPHDAPVVVLLLNPGLGQDDARHHCNTAFAGALRQHVAADRGAPHFHLLDETHGPGQHWWLRKCRALIERVGVVTLANNLLCIEFAPYHSKVFAHGHVRFPSQHYNFQLLRNAIRRQALIVCMRGERLWRGAVPEIGNCITPITARAGALSRGNLGDANFERLLAAIG